MRYFCFARSAKRSAVGKPPETDEGRFCGRASETSVRNADDVSAVPRIFLSLQRMQTVKQQKRMLRKLRIAAAVVCFTLVTLLFLDFTGTLHAWFGWLARIQFLPALLALNAGVVAALVVATLLLRPHLLLGGLSAGRDAGRHLARGGPAHQKPLPLLARQAGAALHSAGAFHPVARSRHRTDRRQALRPAGPLQRLRTHRAEPAGTALGLGKQPAGPTAPNASTATPSTAPRSGCAARRPSPWRL